ncbi:LacI family DNA-binding transcriptional regulator [Paenibacillus agricola]|uniref:LacI family transcriptional regulator n=1 Tax=Paenibacillus agricola TaxID=2716264 RepID=A0ABX0J521_9BACL|nr:LacI family DNA-binding transcriptional regulator [Paenibacillus agricola]NHN31415.1 LacI family transcriptional regulator [Paenibacillus agricola]
MRRKKQITLHHVAAELGLTIHTVSKALRGLPGMSETTRRDVFAAAERLGYKTKEKELSLGYEKTPMLSSKRRRFCMVLTHDTPFFRIQLQGIQDRLLELGHSVSASFMPSSIDSQQQFEQWVEQIELHYYDGIFIPATIPDLPEQLLLQLPIPKVLINFPPVLANVDSVIWDVVTAIHQSVDYLAAMGHRRILYIGNIHTYRGFQLRWQAFQDAMNGMGMSAEPELHLTEDDLDHELWISRLQEKLLHGNYTALLSAVENNLPRVLYTVQAMNRSIPDHYSLISLENSGKNPLFPQLSRPTLLIGETGSRAAERMLWRIANPNQPYEHIRLQGTFFKGDTVRSLSNLPTI